MKMGEIAMTELISNILEAIFFTWAGLTVISIIGFVVIITFDEIQIRYERRKRRKLAKKNDERGNQS